MTFLNSFYCQVGTISFVPCTMPAWCIRDMKRRQPACPQGGQCPTQELKEQTSSTGPTPTTAMKEGLITCTCHRPQVIENVQKAFFPKVLEHNLGLEGLMAFSPTFYYKKFQTYRSFFTERIPQCTPHTRFLDPTIHFVYTRFDTSFHFSTRPASCLILVSLLHSVLLWWSQARGHSS